GTWRKPMQMLLKLTVLSEDRLQMKWKEAEGPVQGYKVRVRPISDEPQPELMLTTTRGRATVAGLDSQQEYSLQILTINGTQERLIAKRRFTSKGLGTQREDGVGRKRQCDTNKYLPILLSSDGSGHPSSTLTVLSTARKVFECDSSGAADIVLVVDGSWSIGRTNFKRVRDFLEGLVTPFTIGSSRVQIALTQYSGDPRTEWQLNNFTSRQQLLEAVRNFRYKGGNTFTGQALIHVLEENLKEPAGARPNTPSFLILLTDGKSQDDAIAAANRLKKAGVEIIAVGVKNADEAELRQVASEPLELNVYNVNDFPLLSKLVPRLARILCGKIEDRSKRPTEDPAMSYPSPTDLVLSELASREVRLSWTAPSRSPKQYRVVFHSMEGQNPQEVVVNGKESSVLLKGLSSQTQYHLSIFPVYENNVGPALRGTFATRESLTHSLFFNEDAILEGVEDDKEYQISMSALYTDGAQSEAVAIRYSTLSGGGPSSVTISEETPNSLLLSWVPPNAHVLQYHVSYSALTEDSQEQTVLVPGNENHVRLQTLFPDTRYSVLVTAEYKNREGGSASAQGKTGDVCLCCPGFDMMEAFGLTQRAHSSVEGVSIEPFIFSTLPSYTLFQDVQLTQSTRFIHPAGLSAEHIISIAFRLLQDTPQEPFTLWQLTDIDFEPKMGVALDPVKKQLLYFSLDYRGEVQELMFDQPQVQRLFYGSFHKVHLSVSQVSVSLSVDCQHVGERPARPLGNLPTDGFEMLGKLLRTRGPRSGSATFQLQSFEIVCNTTWVLEDTCCDIPAQVSIWTLRHALQVPFPSLHCVYTGNSFTVPGSVRQTRCAVIIVCLHLSSLSVVKCTFVYPYINFKKSICQMCKNKYKCNASKLKGGAVAQWVGPRSCSPVGLGFKSRLGCLVTDWRPVLGVSPPPPALRPELPG
uniref:Collagen alpha-1(XX) chain-like n=1 Tax=Scleropages formosus TaxID=113540 RepID=A0A8C9VV67_SCLFO